MSCCARRFVVGLPGRTALWALCRIVPIVIHVGLPAPVPVLVCAGSALLLRPLLARALPRLAQDHLRVDRRPR
eukprot:5253813-Alexandrium_andersonii.AAC.1